MVEYTLTVQRITWYLRSLLYQLQNRVVKKYVGKAIVPKDES
jgi:hypothetical protein